MKQLTNKEYVEYEKYKTAVLHGRVITPDGLRIICAGLDNDPERIGKHMLETLAKDGVPTRAEITDAALSERSSCVMLNKGKYIVMAIRMLDKIVRRMEKFRTKSENVLPKQDGAEKLMLSHRKYDI